jgi:two-component system OmpR family sensor kinase
VAIVAALIAAVSLAIGAVTVFALQDSLIGQLDHGLIAASHRASSAGEGAGVNRLPPLGTDGSHPDGPPPGSFVGSPGQSAKTVVAAINDGAIVAGGYVDTNGSQHELSAAATKVVLGLPTNGTATTADLGSGLGSYRLIATSTNDGTVLVTGLPLNGVQDVVNRLALVVGLVTAGGVLFASAAGALSIRAALRPLRRIATVASGVTDITLDKGEVALSVRVPQRDLRSSAEVNQVGSALNELLGHVSEALDARQAAEDQTKRFVADASHELRTPLASIRAYAELSRRDYGDAPDGLRRNVGRIESEALRMSSLVDDLLLLAHLDSGTELQLSEVDLSQLVLEAIGDAHAVGADHRWLIDLPSEPVSVLGDEQRLHQVIANLLANARVHTPAGTTVTVTVRPPTVDGAPVILRVTDDGPGIAHDLLPHLFERFARGDSSRSRGTGGAGLGLSIARAIAESHGGTLDVESRTGTDGMTSFTLSLPGFPAPTGRSDDVQQFLTRA